MLARLGTLAWLASTGMGVGCAPILRAPEFVGAQDRSTEASLLGPFDGQVIDATTSEPISGATLIAMWTYDEGRGPAGAAGSHVETFVTDAAGRYKIPAHKPQPRRAGQDLTRLVAFDLVVYKRGYVGYRSDVEFEGRPRHDFVQRHNRVALRKWRETDSHATHLAFLRPPAELHKLVAWEREAANEALYRSQTTAAPATGDAARPDATDAPPDGKDPKTVLGLLDAAPLLPPDEVKRRTGYAGEFALKDLGDLTRTHFYHGLHLQAVDRGEDWDVAIRVWKNPPAGLDSVEQTFEATLPDVEPTAELTERTWIYDSEDVRAVAFLDAERSIGVLLTCGGSQCVDIETAMILAKFVFNHLDRLSENP